MEVKQFEEFMLVKEQRSIRTAANILKISPAALSRRMAGFERAVGVTLFYVSEKSWLRILTGIYSIISFGILVTQNSDSAFMAIAGIMLLLIRVESAIKKPKIVA